MKITLKSGMLIREQRQPKQGGHSGDSNKQPEVPVLRILGILKDPDHSPFSSAALIRCDKQAMPFVMALQRLEELVTCGDYVVINEAANPAAPGIRCAEDLGEGAKEFSAKIAENAGLIASVIDLGWSAFILKARAKAINQLAAGKVDGVRHAKSWINKLLWRFWSAGTLALGPGYHRCGALAREVIFEQWRERKDAKEMKRPGRSHKNIGKERAGPDYDRGGSYISPKCAVAISSIIDNYFKEKENMTIVRTSLERRDTLPWKAIRDHVESELSELPEFAHVNPSVAQVKWIGNKSTNVIKVRRAAQGNRYVDLNHRAFSGDYRDVTFAAGHRYELDASLTDIHLVDDVTKLVIGRANIIWVVDSYSGMIVGVYVTTKDITYAHVARALHGTFDTKSKWCSLFDLKIDDREWPCQGRCAHLTTDNAHLNTKAADWFAELIGDSGICPSYRPDRKGLVECTAELANIGLIHFFHYGVTKGPKERAKEDMTKQGVVSVQAFIRELISWVVNVANHRPLPVDRELDRAFLATGALPTPFNVWNWSVGVHGGPPHVYDPAHWMPRLLERAEATITRYGLELDGVYFDAPDSKAFQEIKEAASDGKVKHLPVHVDRLSTKQVYLVPDDITLPPQPVPLAHISRECAGLSFDEIELQKNSRVAKTDDAKIQHQRRAQKHVKRVKKVAKADLATVKEHHGSFKNRERTASGTDLDKVADSQGKADDKKITDAMHGKPTAPSASNETVATNAKGVRPSCLSS